MKQLQKEIINSSLGTQIPRNKELVTYGVTILSHGINHKTTHKKHKKI